MSNSRKQLIAQIAEMDAHLHLQQMQVRVYKSSLKKRQINYSGLLLMAFIIPTLFISWKMSRGNWINKLTTQLTELVTLTLMSYFRKQLINFFKQLGA